MPISDTWLRKNLGKKEATEKNVTDRDGLTARLRNGKIDFVFRGTHASKRFRMVIGRYPEMSLKDARAKVIDINALLADGIDPRKKKVADKLKNESKLTVSELYTRWYEQYAVLHKKRHNQHRRTFEIYVRPALGNAIVEQVTRSQWVQFFLELSSKVPETTMRAIGDIRQAINHGIDQGIVELERNPLEGVNRRTLGLTKGQINRTLSEDDLRIFYRVLLNKKQIRKNAIMSELMLFYGARSGEIRLVERSDIDLESMTWTIPWTKTKTGHKTHRDLKRPIIPEMKHLWEEALELSQCDQWVFPANRDKIRPGAGSPMSPGAVESLALQMQVWAQRHLKDDQGVQVTWDHWTNHDLRRTARTWWSQWGDWAVCEKMLDHKLPGDADVYDRHDYLEAMTPIYKKWWMTLKALQRDDPKVVPLHKGRRQA